MSDDSTVFSRRLKQFNDAAARACKGMGKGEITSRAQARLLLLMPQLVQSVQTMPEASVSELLIDVRNVGPLIRNLERVARTQTLDVREAALNMVASVFEAIVLQAADLWGGALDKTVRGALETLMGRHSEVAGWLDSGPAFGAPSIDTCPVGACPADGCSVGACSDARARADTPVPQRRVADRRVLTIQRPEASREGRRRRYARDRRRNGDDGGHRRRQGQRRRQRRRRRR